MAPAATVLGLAFALLLQPAAPEGIREVASSVGLMLGGLLGAASCIYRAALTRGRRRRAWALITSAGVVALAGNLWSTVVGADPVDAPSDFNETALAAALLLSIVALLNFPSVRRRGFDLLMVALDALVAGAAVLIIASVLVYSQLPTDRSEGLDTYLIALALPGLDVVLASVAVLLVLRSVGSDRPALSLVAGGFIAYAGADLAFAVLAGRGTFEFGSLLDLGWIAGYGLIGLSAWYPSDITDIPSGRTAVSDTIGTVTVFIALLTAAVVQAIFGTEERLDTSQALLWLILLLLVGVRQTLLTRDSAALRRGLERRVREQTSDLRRLARQNEVLVTSVGDGIYGVDHSGRITFINPSGARALGYAPEELQGRRAHDEFHAPGADGRPYPWAGCYVTEAIRDGVVSNAEEDVYLRADGTQFPVEITASPLLDEDEVRGAVVVFRDMTQRREVDRMKNEFLSVVSHELRTPLTSIRGSLGLLASGRLGELPERAAPMVTIALDSSERLIRLINDILDIERLESGTGAKNLVPLSALELLESSVLEMEGFAAARGVELTVLSSTGDVLADRDRLVQTLTNLLSNAVNYSEEGGVVEVAAVAQDGQVLFSVRDEGRGIPADQLESIFGRFQQVDSSDARQKGGTGLGLAICRGIVESHGGQIWVESELGTGTAVLFTLPRAGAAGLA
ncbi:hypothetical protein GCM10027026_41650 [Myroides odoratimimus subsp. xuanwuensis]